MPIKSPTNSKVVKPVERSTKDGQVHAEIDIQEASTDGREPTLKMWPSHLQNPFGK
jgi:hypothetical protein